MRFNSNLVNALKTIFLEVLKVADTKDIRNVVLLGHGSSGKTSITESILHTCGVTNRLGSVDEKSSICDSYEEEKEHQHSIQSAIVHADYKGKTINVIDTPGYPDFMGTAIPPISAAETAVLVISAAAGIETNTRKLFQLATNQNKPRIIVVNKIDADNIDINALINEIKETFGSQCQFANLINSDASDIIDCIENEEGDSPLMDVSQAHTELIESIIEADDELMEKYLGGEDIPKEKIASVFVEALKEGTVIPILFTNARQETGISELLDMIVNYTPSPEAAGPVKIKQGEEETEIKPDPDGPLAGAVFKISMDPRSNMKYSTIKLLSGKITSSSSLIVNDEKKGIRPGHIYKMQGNENKEIEEGIAGDIITLSKVEELQLGDLVHDDQISGTFELPKAPVPMFSLALEPANRGDEQKLSIALEKLSQEDPCFQYEHNQQTNELVIKGLGELHLRMIIERMKSNFKLEVSTKPPKIPYRETITGKAEGHYRHKKQTGGAGQFGEVFLRIEPAERGSDPTLEFSWDIFGGAIPSQFEGPVRKGIEDVMKQGVVAGYPMQDVKVSIYDGKHHPVDSQEVAFRSAGKGAFADAVKKAKPALLEPVVNMEITVPADCMGDIAGDMASKRGKIVGQDMLPGNMVCVKAQVPLAEVMQYNTQLKSVTGGQGSYSMEFSHYEPVPSNVQQQIAEKAAAEKESE
jgi:elongation factor G